MAIETWAQYKNWVETVIGVKKDYYYRGQRDPSWILQTTFHRHAEDFNLTLPDYLNSIIPEIHHYVSAQYDEIFNLQIPEEFGSFLALIQHHGFPTPLLDWTLSPYVAAYFAYRDVDVKSPQTDHVKIYVFDFQEWIATFEQPVDLREWEKSYVSVIRPFAKYNPRLIPQRGTYTVTNVLDLEAHILALAQEKKKTFYMLLLFL